jgi:hypothetical protein
MKAIKFLAIALGLISIVSCEKDPSKPVISGLELGYENSKTAYVGGELHMDAEIVAEARIDYIEVSIHPEGDHGKKLVLLISSWEMDTVYTKFSGLKNTTFHEHIEIANDAEPGEYHFHMKVVDREGNSTEAETEIEILEPAVK